MALPVGSSQPLTYGQLEGYWIAAGGPSRVAPVAAAIAMAESRGKPTAYNPTDNGGTQSSYGLWQISTGTHAPPSPNWADPLVNARLAVQKWKSGGWKPWGTYNSGAYASYLKRGVQPVSPDGSATGQAGVPYRNPFRGVRGLTPERVDMGVDYAGTGPVYALGPGRITAVNQSWAGGLGTGPGTWITERLSAGPLAGKQVYLSEHVTPQVKPGQQVTAGTVIGQMTGGIETGIAAPGSSGQQGTTLAAQLGEIPTSGDPGANPTAAGAAYSHLLRLTGAPGGVIPTGVAPVGIGNAPSWLQNLSNLPIIGPIIGGLSGVSGIAGAINNIGGTLSGLASAIDWLLQPANWVRIVAGVGGGVLVIGGVVTLSHAGESLRGPLTSRPAALPVGILMVGAGGVLLFVAFHNLPGSPANVGELLGSLRDQAQAATAGQAAA